MNNPFPLHVEEVGSYFGMGEWDTRGKLVDNNGNKICYSDYLEQKDIDYLNEYVKSIENR